VPENEPERTVALAEIAIYLRVWRVLYPDAEIEAGPREEAAEQVEESHALAS
jgi:hypothetical protein